MQVFLIYFTFAMHCAAALTRSIAVPRLSLSVRKATWPRSLRCSSTGSSARCSRNTALSVPTADDMEDVGGLLASLLLETKRPKGAIVFLEGDLGAGKSCFARGFVRGATGDWNMRVTSPTFLLSNTYRATRNESEIEIHHMDLYRLSGNPEDFVPLNLDFVFRECISLIEWPVRLSNVSVATDHRLQVDIRLLPSANDDNDNENIPRRLILSYPEGSSWGPILDQIREEGLLDDMVISTS